MLRSRFAPGGYSTCFSQNFTESCRLVETQDLAAGQVRHGLPANPMKVEWGRSSVG